ncbi:hypothetical protein ACI8AV_06340 [Geodermatophilus sp. SYSU D00804]
MADVPTPPDPGSMTVPPLFGWESIVVGLLLLVAVVVVLAVVGAARSGAGGRADFQSWLDARSARSAGPHDGTPGVPRRG